MTTSLGALSGRRLKDLEQLMQKLGVTFGRMSLLNEALTHTSYAAENPQVKHYERLEFFGDAVLKFVISEYLLERFQEYNEGQLTEIRSVLISDKTLGDLGSKLNLSKYILLGKQVQMRPSIVAKSLEAVIGAIYIDLGLIHVQNFVVGLFGSQATAVDRDDVKDNFKAQLQELTQSKSQGVPVYKVEKIDGPAHEPIFSVSVLIAGEIIASGTGYSKKSAEQNAAQSALNSLGLLERAKSNSPS